MKKYCLFLAGIIFMNSNFIFAGALTWEKVFSEGKEKNLEIINAEKSLESARISYKGSYTNYAPSISGSAGWRKSGSDTDESESFSYGLSGRLTLFSGFKNSSDVKKKRSRLNIQEARFRRTVSDVVYELKLAFADVLKTQRTIALYEEIHKRRRDNMELVRLKYDAGREDKGAYLGSEADYYQAGYELNKALRNLKIKQVRLLKGMGREHYDVVNVTGSFTVSTPEDIHSFREFAGETPEFFIAQNELEASVHDLRYTKGEFYPQASFSAGISRSGSEFPLESRGWNMGLSLSYPFFSGGRDFYSLRTARLNNEIAEVNLRLVRQNLSYRIEKAYNDLADAAEYLKVKERYYTALKQRSEILGAKYINGLISYQEWNMIENESINSEKSLLEAQYGAFIALAEWKKILGEEE